VIPTQLPRRLALLVLALSATAFAQSTPKPTPDLASHPTLPTAVPADVASPVAIVHAFYAVISAPSGGKLDRPRLQSLFLPSGRIAIGLEPESTRPADVLFVTPTQYAVSSDTYTATHGFFDHNLANQVDTFGVMAHVYSTYESRSNPSDPKPMARGIKSFELLNSNHRWYILQVYWDSERPDNPISDRYLHDNPAP
jgi:hypothetical protein